MVFSKKSILIPFSFYVLTHLYSADYTVIEDQATLPILNPALEGRKTEKLVLSNGMKVYLISDPGAEQSAAGLAVEAGSWDDPKEYPGMAHFLEHMLFMGTAAYPKEFEFAQYVIDHGGKYNAFTSSDRTVYMFSINNEAFESTIGRFSHFFIDPLLAPHCIERELHAVDQEHAKNIEHDGWRQWMIFKETGNPDHPHSTFSTGNAHTLSGIPQAALKNWYESHYSANRMHLAIISPLPLDKLRDTAVQAFLAVPSFSVSDKQLPATFTSGKQRGHAFFIKPVKEIKQLSLSWEIPGPFAQDIERQAAELIAYALNRAGENSLLELLKEEKLAEKLYASTDRFSKNALMFSIDIYLTDKGVSALHKVIEHVFQAIARIREEGYPRYLFDELQTVSTLNYQYQSREDAFKTIIEIAAQMPYEDLSTFPQKSHIPTDFDTAFITEFLEILKPVTCLYCVMADPNKTRMYPNKKEKWMQAEYAIKKINPNSLKAWSAPQLNPRIQLPTANLYLPNDLSLVQTELQTEKNQPATLLRDDKSGITYHILDTYYKVPEICFIYTFKSPLITHSVESQILLDLYIYALKEKLSPLFSFTSSAGLASSIFADHLAFKVMVQGYNDKAPLLMQTIFSTMKELQCDEEDFAIYRTSLTDYYNNTTKELPVVQAIHQLDGLIFNMPTNYEKAEAISKISFDQFTAFNQTLLKSLYTQSLLYGNISEKQAKNLDNVCVKIFDADTYPVDQHIPEKVLLLSNTQRPRKISQITQRQGNGVLLLLQEGPFTFETRGIQQILGTALQEAFFDTLRTKQQTAYYLKAWNSEEKRQLLQYFAVQSSTHETSELLARFELFLEDYDKNLALYIPKKRFESLRDNLITLISIPPENMRLMAIQLNKLGFEYRDFSWIEKRVQSLRELTYERFCSVAHKFLARNHSRRLAVLMEGVLPPENDFRYEAISKEEVERLGTFVNMNNLN